MTTVLAPGAGSPILFTQGGVGTTPGYSATDLRRGDSQGSVQEGVQGSGALGQDFMVQQRIAGANMQIEITMAPGGVALVQGDTISGQGLYTIPVHSANVLETIGTADPTNPRVDQVILEVKDNAIDGSGGNLVQTRVLPGIPTGGANLTNRTGAAVLPGSALLLADVLVGAAAGSITNAVIRDRRKWARGAFGTQTRTAGNYTTSSTSFVDIDTTNVVQRIECSGAPMRIWLWGSAFNSIAAVIFFIINQDGTPISALEQHQNAASSMNNGPVALQWNFTPAAGSHLFLPRWRVSGGTGTLFANTTSGLQFIVEEIVRQNTANNTITTG